MSAALKCPRCGTRMHRIDEGVFVCVNSHRWLDDTPEPEEHWVPDGVSLSYVEGTVKGGGGQANFGPSPAQQKYDAYLRRILPGSHARNIPFAERPIRLTKP